MAKVVSVKIDDHSPEFLDKMHEQVIRGLESIGQEAEGYAKEETPTDTGRLKNSITHQVVDAENAVYIGTNVEYAPYVEYNDMAHHNTGKAHFLRDAATNHSDHYKAIMEASLKE